MSDATSFYDKLVSGMQHLEISLDRAAVERMHLYFTELKKWSRKVNLIGKGAKDDEIIENHFLDSLTLLPLVQKSGCHLLDVGTGAGFPGLVLKAAHPPLRLTLVEPRLKRVSFLKHVVRTLQLADVEVLACRVEDEKLLPSATDFTHITGRAVSEIGLFLQMVDRFAKPGLEVICMKGPRWRQELDRAEPIVQEVRFVQDRVIAKVLPFSSAERALVIFKVED